MQDAKRTTIPPWRNASWQFAPSLQADLARYRKIPILPHGTLGLQPLSSSRSCSHSTTLVQYIYAFSKRSYWNFHRESEHIQEVNGHQHAILHGFFHFCDHARLFCLVQWATHHQAANISPSNTRQEIHARKLDTNTMHHAFAYVGAYTKSLPLRQAQFRAGKQAPRPRGKSTPLRAH
jgi:hypothetical protein